LSTVPTWVLNRASRSAAQAAYRNATTQPTRPMTVPSNFSADSDQ